MMPVKGVETHSGPIVRGVVVSIVPVLAAGMRVFCAVREIAKETAPRCHSSNKIPGLRQQLRIGRKEVGKACRSQVCAETFRAVTTQWKGAEENRLGQLGGICHVMPLFKSSWHRNLEFSE